VNAPGCTPGAGEAGGARRTPVLDPAARLPYPARDRSGSKAFLCSSTSSSPWLGLFDVLDATASPSLADSYACVICLDESAGRRWREQVGPKAMVFSGGEADAAAARERLSTLVPLEVTGDVGCAWARQGDAFLLGIFHNRRKGPQGEQVLVKGDVGGADPLLGSEFLLRRTPREIELEMKPGAVAILRTRPGSDLKIEPATATMRSP